MPAVMIGVGGIGGEIVSAVRKQIELHVAKSKDKTAMRNRADQFRFLHVDTRKMPFHAAFDKNEVFVVPEGTAAHGVNAKVQTLDISDPFFPSWWLRSEPDGESPYLPGDFSGGAGQVRAKGKLAYRIDLNNNGDRIIRSAMRQIQQIDNVLNVAVDETGPAQINVYIVSSLGGGTGSGIVLALAQHLREVIPSHCVLIGVFLTAGIAAAKAGDGFADQVRANTDAALREIDFWQSAPLEDVSGVSPFLQWPDNQRIPGHRQPFDLIYLYTQYNAAGKVFLQPDDYVQLASECLSTELFSDLDDEISGLHSNFIQRFDSGRIHHRSNRYASAGKADLRYPVDRIIQHLARKFGARVILEQVLLGSQGERYTEAIESGSNAMLAWAASQKLTWGSQNGLQSLLAETNLNNGNPLNPVPQLRGPDFESANLGSAEALVQTTRQQVNNWLTQSLKPHLDHRVAEVVESLVGADGSIFAEVTKLLTSEDARGYVRAKGGVDALIRTLEQQTKAIAEALNPSGGPATGQLGLQERVSLWNGRPASTLLLDPWTAGSEVLANGFRGFRKDGKKAKEEFLNEYWDPFVLDSVSLEVANASNRLLSDLLSFLRGLQGSLRQIETGLAEQASQFTNDASSDLGEKAKAGVLDVGVMDDGVLVDHHFAGDIVSAFQADSLNVGIQVITGSNGISDVLQKITRGQGWTDVKEPFRAHLFDVVTGYGRERFGETVNSLSVWEALEIEARLRLALDRADPALLDAKVAASDHVKGMVAAGLQSGDYDSVLLRKFIAQKLRICKERSAPFWKLDELALSSHGEPSLPYPFAVLGYEKRSYGAFVTKTGLVGLIEEIEQDLGVTAGETPGTDSIHFYQREGGVPLHFLISSELEDLRRSSALLLERNQQLYTDRRYRDLVPSTIRSGESPQDRLSYSLATLASLGNSDVDIRVTVSIDYANRDAVAVDIQGSTHEYRGLREASEDSRIAEAIHSEANRYWMGKLYPHPAADLKMLINFSSKMARLAPPGLEQQWWANVLKLMERRQRYEWYLV